MMVFTKSRRAQNKDDYETWIEGNVSPTLNVFDNGGEVRATVLIFEATRVEDVRMYEHYSPTVATYWGTGGARVPYVHRTGMVKVRRLTPIDCERLQGFPDDWTAGQSDSQRYRQMGNAVTVNVIESIGQQLGRVSNG
jgi:site-specific DNA-cytosine methylase